MLYKDKKRRLGDRYDGFKLRKVDTLFQLIPVIMRTRTDSLYISRMKLILPRLSSLSASIDAQEWKIFLCFSFLCRQ